MQTKPIPIVGKDVDIAFPRMLSEMTDIPIQTYLIIPVSNTAIHEIGNKKKRTKRPR